MREVLFCAIENPKPHGDASKITNAGVSAVDFRWLESAIRLSRYRVFG